MNPSSVIFQDVANRLKEATATGVTPCVTLEVGHTKGVYWEYACGRLTYDVNSPPATPETIFDLASLTKVIATTTVVMKLVDTGKIGLNDRLKSWLPSWRDSEKSEVTVADLLEHTSGLTAHLPFYRDCRGREEFEHQICSLPLEYAPRSRSIYSDLGFILLGFLATDASHGKDLGGQFDTVAKTLTLGDLRFRPPAIWNPRIAPTEVDPWRGRLLRGEVHDENGWALGGVAGHAGLFGTVRAVGRFARAVLKTLSGDDLLVQPATLARFIQKSPTPGSSRALGWDSMVPTSSCGHRFSPKAIGHTGYTGTSLWIDQAQDLYVAILTNRVHPTRTNEAILQLRPNIHDAVVMAVESQC